MESILALLDTSATATFALGTVFGMIVWDLAFEARSPLGRSEVEAAQTYYRGLHTAPRLVVVVLPLAALVAIVHFVRLGSSGGELARWIAFGLLLAAIAIEVVFALPRETNLFQRLGSVAQADESTFATMQACVRGARNVHLVMTGLVLTAAWIAFP